MSKKTKKKSNIVNSTSRNSTSRNSTSRNSTSRNSTSRNSTSRNSTSRNSTSRNSTSRNSSSRSTKDALSNYGSSTISPVKRLSLKKEDLEKLELEILRKAQDAAEQKRGEEAAQSPDVKKIIKILEKFLKDKKLICYGGTAINNILPSEDQFYDRDIEIPDYDFFSPNALKDAKELADIYRKKNFEDVVAQAGVHAGTFKVFINFIPVADITYLPPVLFKTIKKEAIKVNNILYAPPNYLRMAMYLELSRPAGDVSRWEKVLKRLRLLNNHYPLEDPKCDKIKFMRDFEGDPGIKHRLYTVVKDSLINQGLVFFGGFACTLYGQHLPKRLQREISESPDFDVLSEDPETAATIVKERLQESGFKKVKIKKFLSIGEIIASHYQITVDKDVVCFIYEPIACHSYNTISHGRRTVKVASIDTMLSFYLAFIYANRPYYDKNRIICMAQYLLEAQIKNRLEQEGLLKRFSTQCYGYQKTIEDIRAEKAAKFKELRSKRNTPEYEEYFLRYIPEFKESKKSLLTRKVFNKKNKYTRKRKIATI